MLRTKQQVSSAAQPAAMNDHLLGPPLDSFQQVVLFPDHAAATNHNAHTTDNNDEGGVAYRQPLQNAELPPSSAAAACVSDTTAPPSMVFDPTLVVTFSETNHHTSAVFRPPPSLSSLLPAGAPASPTSSSALKSVKGLSRGGQQLSSCPVSTRQQHPPLTTPEAVVHHGGTSPPDRANDPVRNVLLSHRLRVVSGGTRQVLSDRHNVSSNSPWPDDEISDNVMFRTNQQHVDGIAKYKTHTTMMRVPTSGNNAIDFFGEDAGCRPLPSSPAARRPPPSPPMAAEKNSPPWVMSEYHHGTPTHLKPLVQIDSPELPSTAMNRSAQVFYDPSVAAASAGHHPHLQYQQQPMARGVATADFFHSKEEFLSADLHSESVMRMSHHHHRRAGLHTGPLRPHLQQPTMPIEHPLSFPTQQQQQFHWGGGGSGGAHEMPRRPPPGFNGHHLLPQQPHHHHHHYRAHHQLFVPQHHQHHPHSHHPQHQVMYGPLPQQQQQMIYHHDRGAPSYDHNRWHQHHVQQHPFPSQSYHPQHYRHGFCDSIPPNQLPRFNNLSGQSSIGFRTFQQ
ncbi:Hypothetical protein, putative [Bodo saltans]|uniref:Uncharacterized protein n=1 Tax=Bodo saltans TaxID=75058 RepID=A0A0S4ISH7_BODSA|nr:Hypothetical protein, putative [Bodo saltans]|eukprot:CUG05944.1 Hypothetical protein, putative [Bodo saltans]